MLSVILCTHDPRDAYLREVVSALKSQDILSHDWELVLVDNASARPVSEGILNGFQSHWRIVRETTLGLTAARLRGIRESQGEVLVFVDDDNVLDASFLSAAASVSTQFPWLGAWSGSARGKFEVKPPSPIVPYLGNLVIRNVATDRWSNVYGLPETSPLGAGLCVRRPVADAYLKLHVDGRRSILLDRSGSSLSSGGDIDLAACAIDIGLGTGQMHSLNLEHLIPRARLTEDYHVRLVEGITYSAVVLEFYRPEIPAGRDQLGLAGVAKHAVRKLRQTAFQRRIDGAIRSGRARALRDIDAASS